MPEKQNRTDKLLKKILVNLLKTGVTAALIFLLFRNIGFSALMNRILSADPRWFAAAIAVFLLSMLLSAVQWDLLLRFQGVSLGLYPAFSLYMIGHFFNNFLPGAMGGDIVKVYRLRQDNRRGKEGLAATFLDRFAGLFVLSFCALASAVWLHYFSSLGMAGGLYRYIALLFGLFFVLLFFLFSRRVSAFFYDTLLRNINPMGLRDKVQDIHAFLHQYRGQRKLYLYVLGLSSAIQFLRIAVHAMVAQAIGFQVPFIYFLLFVPLIALIASLPVSIGGLGVREGIGSLLFGTVASNPGLAVAAQFLASVVGILVSLTGGILFIFRKKEAFSETHHKE